ncbi:MAG: aminodeoxychorismate/anthranilate synthase component II [Deltaproteobacteria bacterium]|nr:aminodeoxychorismate/anthranilate synthase component II [Deltaproteobacteria bacterium]
MFKILLIDNYDSFTYNLLYLLKQIGCKQVEVVRNDKFDISYVEQFDRVVISPGPGVPREAGLMLEVIRRYGSSKGILGVCLGHQGIVEVFGGSLINMDVVVHGKALPTRVIDPGEVLFKGLPETFLTGRYHSWVADKDSLPGCLKITAEDEAGRVMAVSHENFDVRGVQFHPESILTEHGDLIMRNWIALDSKSHTAK